MYVCDTTENLKPHQLQQYSSRQKNALSLVYRLGAHSLVIYSQVYKWEQFLLCDYRWVYIHWLFIGALSQAYKWVHFKMVEQILLNKQAM